MGFILSLGDETCLINVSGHAWFSSIKSFCELSPCLCGWWQELGFSWWGFVPWGCSVCWVMLWLSFLIRQQVLSVQCLCCQRMCIPLPELGFSASLRLIWSAGCPLSTLCSWRCLNPFWSLSPFIPVCTKHGSSSEFYRSVSRNYIWFDRFWMLWSFLLNFYCMLQNHPNLLQRVVLLYSIIKYKSILVFWVLLKVNTSVPNFLLIFSVFLSLFQYLCCSTWVNKDSKLEKKWNVCYSRITEEKNIHRMTEHFRLEGTCGDHPPSLFKVRSAPGCCSGLSPEIFSTFKERDSATSLGSQWMICLTVKIFYFNLIYMFI